MRACSLLTLTLLLGLSLPTVADSECTSASRECVEVGQWQIGLGVGGGLRTNPVINRKDIPLVLLPEISYTGERFFIQNLDLGLVLWENTSHRINLLATPSYDQVFFHRWNPGNFVMETATRFSPPEEPTPPTRQEDTNQQPPPDIPGNDDNPPPTILGFKTNSQSEVLFSAEPRIAETTATTSIQTLQIVDLSRLHKRRMAALAGLEYSLDLEHWSLQAQWLQDISGVHDGQEARLSLTRYHYWGKHGLALSLGANWQSDAVIDYYYGIRPGEVINPENVYVGKAGISTLASLEWRYALSERWTLRFHTSYRQLASEIHESPLIEQDRVISAFIGGVYHF